MSLYVIGIGPGGRDGMTLEAAGALEAAEVIVGYTVYTELLRADFPEKEYYSTPMKQEKQRCRWALERAAGGVQVAVVCSGDAGIYGMAGLLYQLRESMRQSQQTENAGQETGTLPDIRVIPGVTAANSGAALLGAPLTHDFAVISLSDLLTPLETIEKRLRCAAMADMVICLYNPSSRKRADYLQRACDIILEYQRPETICGYVRNIGREGEQTCILSLQQLRDAQVDMFTTVYIGNSTTMKLSGSMVTPRGYQDV